MKNEKTRMITFTGMFAALIFLAIRLLPIPVGIAGGYLHFGDTLIYMTAAILPHPFAMLAAAIGGGLADLTTPGAAAWILPTMIIKSLCCLPFTHKSEALLCKRNILAMLIAGLVTIAGYSLAAALIYKSMAGAIAEAPSLVIQAAGSAAGFAVLAAAFDKTKSVVALRGK